MGIFAKKKKNEDEEHEEEKSSGNKKIFKKKDFKDLNSDNKKSRREPKKPWGKTERIVVGGVLFITIAISGYLWLISTGWQPPKFSEISINAPSILSEEVIIIENDN